MSPITGRTEAPEDDGPDAIHKREAEWQALDKVIDEYINGYELDDSYTPTEAEQHMIRDCVAGLLAEVDFMKAIAKVYPIRGQFATPANGFGVSVHEADVIAAAVQLAPLLEEGWDDQDTPEDRNEGAKACDALVAAVNALFVTGVRPTALRNLNNRERLDFYHRKPVRRSSTKANKL